ncbi:hypothetical protein [Sphaerisporangium sp. NPDC051011]|uniref:hypothetical protein n=1 Tax=Sphaerisporangium sp. NPDC051011 TaxID=3155792 RepID=UPI0033C3A582
MADALNVAEALYVERYDTLLRNAALLGLAGADEDTVLDVLEESQDAETAPRHDPEERRALIAALSAG